MLGHLYDRALDGERCWIRQRRTAEVRPLHGRTAGWVMLDPP